MTPDPERPETLLSVPNEIEVKQADLNRARQALAENQDRRAGGR